MDNTLKFIGHIKSPYATMDDCPNNISSDGPMFELIIKEEYLDGLHNLEHREYIVILYWLDQAERKVKIGKSRNDTSGNLWGTFAIRTPHRPNPIGMGVVKIERVEGNVIFVKGLDCINNTQIIDIKPAMSLDDRKA